MASLSDHVVQHEHIWHLNVRAAGRAALGQPCLAISGAAFVLALGWLVFATGRTALFLDTWKFVPACGLFSLSGALYAAHAIRHREHLIPGDSWFLGLTALHLALTVVPSILWTSASDFLD